ncbi:MarP family serine protease [Amnibacterium sp. CER49]|uniref:MarP family serine protease n=1 Tax=Amnibacterium sp. CER49 TaxID=3039161 RepID=UPI00244AC1FC|nr:MarP family serine protease [Amnibacterium sp. CER49]MDH2445034.1 MarP family serine protease [Amnibacterium sp. CER49]
MPGVLDVVLVIVLLAYLVRGYRLGLIRSVGALLGIAAGAIAATFVTPIITRFVADGPARVGATILVALVLVAIGHAAGVAVGSLVVGPLLKSPLGVIDRILGAAANVVVTGLALSVVAGVVAALGVPFLAQPIASSVVLRTLDQLTPAPVDSALAQLRSAVLGSGIPQLGRALGGTTPNPAVPKVDTGTPALARAARSVVKVTGTAYACGQDQSGTGFVVAKDRVLTNAHVLAGVTSPVVLRQDGTPIVGRVTYFDPTADLALIDVSGLDRPALPIDPVPAIGTTGVIDGYPFGGPFSTGGAKVLQVGTTEVPDVAGRGTSPRSLATLAADVEQGNSGGPLLTAAGHVIGIVFAKSSTTADLGYAMTPKQFGGVVAKAPSLTSAVSSGACTRD